MTKRDLDIQKLAQKTVETVLSKKNKENKFETVRVFETAFKKWKKDDLEMVLQTYGKSWLELSTLQLNLEEEGDAVILQRVLGQKRQILHQVRVLAGQRGVDTVTSYVPIVARANRVRAIMKKCYWDMCAKRFNDLDFTDFFNQLNEIVDDMSRLVPNRKDLHKEFGERINVGFIRQQVVNQAFSKEDCNSLFEYISEWLRKFIAADMERDFEKEYGVVHNVIGQSLYFHTVLAQVLKFLVEWLERVKTRILKINDVVTLH